MEFTCAHKFRHHKAFTKMQKLFKNSPSNMQIASICLYTPLSASRAARCSQAHTPVCLRILQLARCRMSTMFTR